MYDIRYAENVAGDLRRLRPAQRRQILDRIDAQLTYQPTEETRNRKILVGLVPPWEHDEPVWQLSIGQFRVFYDVYEAEAIVVIMKVINLERASLDTCIRESQRERVVITREGKPVALIVGVEGLDKEQLELGTSDKFWELIRERRSQGTLSRAELEQRVSRRKSRNGQQSKQVKRP